MPLLSRRRLVRDRMLATSDNGRSTCTHLLNVDPFPDNLPSSTLTSESAPEASNTEVPSPPSAKDNDATPGPAVSEKAQKTGPLLNVPSRTPSQAKKDPSSTSPPLTGATVTEGTASVRRGSKRGFLRKKRDVSKSSSRRTAQQSRNLEVGKASAPAITQSDGATGVDKKLSFGFLSFLSCCTGHHPRNTMEIDEQTIPAKKSKLQPVREKPVSPETRKTTNNTEGVKHSEVKDSLKEKQVSQGEIEKQETPLPADTKPGSEPQPQLTRADSPPENPIGPAAIAVSMEATDTPDLIQDQPLPPAPAEVQPPPVSSIATLGLPLPEVTVQAATPTLDQEELSPALDRTPIESERNSDIDVPDAPKEGEEVIELETAQSPALPKVETPKSELPPPPPLERRQSQVGTQEVPAVPGSSQDKQVWLLPPVQPHLKGRKCLVLDLDETLVHSSFKILNQADFTIPVEIEGQYHNVYVIKRPGVDAFMKRVGELYEVVVFTASVSKYGDPLLDQLDIHHVVHHRLFRESCYNHQGNYVKVSFEATVTDLERLT